MFKLLICIIVTTCLPWNCAGRNGMTWKKYTHFELFGVDMVGCFGASGTAPEAPDMICNPYSGDRNCDTSLPVLCTKYDNSPRPTLPVIWDFYSGWNKGQIRLTSPIRGSVFRDLSEVDQFCEVIFGNGWRTATFHDGGGGWNYYSYGNIASDKRFWVHIGDQNANCWDH
ncbi:unnamed protein product [Adineta ricciae]|uniref:Fibrinogen C-terminal domain-containing protein n=1 Tax=Adineta ricciae TaxID=249248 RepID=A0A816F7T7_ADIRI|nr:unnamed protein product [Adineta ricciae]CAF1657236.1 unnamed protein product [Adineta ricciae]